MVDTSAAALFGLRQDLRNAWANRSPCPAVTALIVQSLLGGRIFRYDLGLDGSDYVNEIEINEEFYRVDLTRKYMHYDPSAFAAEECVRYDLLENRDTYEGFHSVAGALLRSWQEGEHVESGVQS